jgi:two-component system invasion response regulator UvrY
MIRVLIVDDHPIVRAGLRHIISGHSDITVAAEAGDAREALRLAGTMALDVVVLDISMPHMSGFEALNQLRAQFPRLPVLMLSAYDESDAAVRVLKAGASGFMNKELAPGELVTAIRRVVGGRKYISPGVAELLVDSVTGSDRPPHELLSDREYQVLLMISSGKTVSGIAEEMSLSVKTVSTYRVRILEKMNLRNNAELVTYAVRNGLQERPV